MQLVDYINCKYVPLTKIDLWHSLNRNNDNLFRFHSITVQKIILALRQLHCSSSLDIDFISTAMLQLSEEEIAPMLTNTFNHSILSRCFPTEWKQAIVLPILRKKIQILSATVGLFRYFRSSRKHWSGYLLCS